MRESASSSDTNAVAVDPRQAALRAVLDASRHRRRAADRVVKLGRLVIVAMTLGMLVLLARVGQLQFDPAPAAVQIAQAHRATSTMPARRGALLDRHGRILAVTTTATRLFVDSRLVIDPLTFPAHVGRTLNYDPAWISQRMGEKPDGRFIVLDDRVSPQRLADIERLHLTSLLPGVSTQQYLVRHYPQGPLAGQLVGGVGVDGIGLEGLERLHDRQLTGQPGRLMLARAASRRALWLEAAGYQPAEPGRHVRLTLDSVIQTFAEQALREACEKYAAPSGQLVVLDPRSGAILAMANYPAFDPNTLGRSTPQQRRNRCVTDVFEPGSIFKPFVWAGATELGLADVHETIPCHNGLYVTPKGRRLRDVNAYDKLTWEQVLVKSSNIGMAIVGQRMEARRMYDAVRAFGFGQPTGSGLPGEVAGLVHRQSRWTHYSVTSVPMGQEIAVTPLQIVRAMAILANDGLAVQPTIVQEAAEAAVAHPIYERVVSSETAAAVRAALRKAVMEGTGRRADSDVYTVFGKTGTAQVPDLKRGGYLDRQYVASFIGGAPYEQPAIVVGCFIHIDDPSNGYYGGMVSAPLAKVVIDKTLAYMAITPDRPPTDPARLARQ